MENRFPKNVRQIGNVSDTPKIYVEDYVDTFLSQICENTDEEPVGAFLVGRIVKLSALPSSVTRSVASEPPSTASKTLPVRAVPSSERETEISGATVSLMPLRAATS